jgi:hypothetical protein
MLGSGFDPSFLVNNMNSQWQARNRRGAVLPLIAVTLAGVMALLVMAVDVGVLHEHRRIAQTAADAGAMAGSREFYRDKGDSAVPAAYFEATRNGFTTGVNHAMVTVSSPPVSGFYVGKSEFLEVVIRDTVPTIFARIWGRNSVVLKARAVGGVVTPAQGCLFVLDPTASKALEIKSDGDIVANECAVHVNSNAADALSVTNNGTTLDAKSVDITGGYVLGSGAVINPTPETGVTPVTDPLEYLVMPPIPATCDYTDKTVSGGATETLNPGVYCGGLTVQNNLTVANLNPGLYIMKGRQGASSFNIQSGATINSTGTGVTIIITPDDAGNYGIVNLQSGSFVNLTANSDPNVFSPGILFYQDPAAPQNVWNIFHSGNTTTLAGSLYFPTQYIELGGSGANINIAGGVVGRKVKVQSDGIVSLSVGIGGGENSAFRKAYVVE